MTNTTQENRIIKIDTIFGKDKVLLHKLGGYDPVSDLFEFDLTIHSEDHNLSFEKIIGTRTLLTILLENNDKRYISGIISLFQHEGISQYSEESNSSSYSIYRATLVPWLWTLKLKTDCRIFQNKSVPEIIPEVFAKHSLANFEFRLSKSYEKREYCVQYRESDFNFVSRLLEEEGIFYFFEHSDQGEKLIIADSILQFNTSPFYPEINFASTNADNNQPVVISNFNFAQEMKPNNFEIKDFDFKNPTFDLSARIKEKKDKNLEIFDYPGEFNKFSEGDHLVKIRYEEQQCESQKVTAICTGHGFAPGFRFELKNHPRKSFNQEYSVLGVEVQAQQSTYYSIPAVEFVFENRLECIPYNIPFRPKRKTIVPKIVGTQTAFVVGPKGEEIYVDEHGRVKVHFHWDRVEKNPKSSCWIRVSQPWAGTGFGGIMIPRIGQEVIVEFLEGDPDRPIITGRVYNGEAKPPYELPINKAHSGIKSRSTPGGGNINFNGIRMNDEIGKEMMEFQAEKDQHILVKNNNDKVVENCETVQIGVNRSEQVGNNELISIGSNRDTTIGNSETLSVTSTRTHTVGINEAINVGVAQEVSIGSVQIVNVGMTQLINIGLKQKVNAGQEISLKAPNIVLEATELIQIKCGAGIIQIDAAGNITIKSPLVKINC